MNNVPWYLEALRQGVNLVEDMEMTRKDQPTGYDSHIVHYDTAVQREQEQEARIYNSAFLHGKEAWLKFGREIAIKEVMEIIHELEQENIGRDGSCEYESACKDFRAAVEALKGGNEG